MVSAFDEATAVRRRAGGLYDTQADPRFAFVPPGGGPPAANGGILMATVLRAVLDCSPHPHPVATSVTYLRVPDLAPAQVRVSWLRAGGTAATARATLEQDGQPVVEAMVTTGSVARPPAALDGGAGWQGLDWTGPPPQFPAAADCTDMSALAGTAGLTGFAAQVQVLLDPAVAGWRDGAPAGLPQMRGYVGLREPREPDALLLALAVDALPPVVFGLGATGWAPTVELTWHMRAVPSGGPLQVATRARHVSGGWFDEEAEVWDASGRLVAQSRQLARVGRGPLVAVVGT